MLCGSYPNSGMLKVSNISPENEDHAILITHFVSPQQFSYVRLKDVMASASQVFFMEQALVKHCTMEKNERTYVVNQKVIVLFKPWTPPKLLRGVVKKIEANEYIVWILDYGFNLCCSSQDMWPLPETLTTSFWEIKDGGIACISPISRTWSKSCLRIFDKLIEDAVHLSFEAVYQDKANRNFGKLMFKTSNRSKIFQDGAEFLISRMYALRDFSTNISLPTSEAFSFELAELNDPELEARPRIKNIIQLVASSNNPFFHCPNKTVQKPIRSNSSFEMGESEHSSMFNLSQLDRTLELRTAVQVPNSCRLMRSKFSVSNESCVQSALVGPSIKSNENNEMIRNENSSLETDLESVYEDAQTPFDVDFWKNIQLPKRSSSPASSEDSFRTMRNSNQTSSDHSLSSESLKSSTESLLSKSLEEPPLERLKSTSASQNAQEKSATSTSSSAPSNKASAITIKNSALAISSFASSDAYRNAQEKSKTVEATCTPSLPLASVKGGPLSIHNKLDGIYEAHQNKYNVPSIPKNNFKNLKKSTESKKIDHCPADMAVLAHSRQVVDPISYLAELPFCQEINRSLNDLNIRTTLPMHMYSWPHLLNGGSLVLVNDLDSGRAWSYLPVLCSSVLCSLKNSALSRKLKLGPLAILLVDSIGRAKALASNCASLMSGTDPQMLKVVNTHAHSLPTCQMMLLNSCGILITTSDHLLDLMGHQIAMIDPKRLEYFIFDDFDRVRQTTPQALNEVLQILKGMPTSPTMQLILATQQWHAKEFEMILRHIPKPLALFGNFLEAAMYGGLRLKFFLKESSIKANLLLNILAEQKLLKKHTLIYCGHEMELNDLRRILTTAGHECVGPSKAQNQQPHQLWVVSDEVKQSRPAVRNIEVLIHFSLPPTWSMLAERFRVMADQIPNYFTTSSKDEMKQPLLSYFMLDKSNHQEFIRLTEFLRAHGLQTDGAPWMNCQLQEHDNIPFCPHQLSSGECTLVACNKRHKFIPADLPPPGNPLQQEGTVIRCKLYRAYDPGHMAVWPLEYQTTGSTEWVDVPYPFNKWISRVELSMGTKQNVHSPCRLGDVCFIHHLGIFKRVKIVDIQQKCPVTVQVMDYGTELLHVYQRHLLQCPEERIRTLPPLAMDIRFSGMSAGESKWVTDTTQWVQKSLSSISDRQQMQITVEFAMINVVYVKEVTLVEECPTMRTSVYKLLLRKELINRGFAQMDSQSDRQLRELRELQKEVNRATEGNKENIKLTTRNACHPECKKTNPCSLNTESKEPTDIPKLSKTEKPEPMMEAFNRVQTKKELAKADTKHKKSPSTKTIGTSNENIAPSSPEAGIDQSSTSTEALCNALMQELSSPKKQDNHMFLQSILKEMEITNQKKPTKQREFKLEDEPQEACRGPSVKPVSQSLQYSTISKGAVRPRVKWYQTTSHIELTIEQQVPEYELCLEGKTLIYNVPTSSPPQHLVLPLLGEVRLVSQKQHGFYLRIKLAKVGILTNWPTIFDSVYAQKHSPWLTYDVERADEPSAPAGLVMWERYSRLQVNKDDDSSEDEELFSDDCEPGVERSGSVEIFDDC